VKLAGYVRVSGKAQLDGYGLDAQKREVRAWAKRNGHRITTWHADEAVSGTTDALDRDGLAGALQDVCGGRVDGIVVARLDRVARSLTVQEAALAHVWRCGGRVFTADGGEVVQDDPDDPMRTAMRQMVGVFSELERAMITKRLRNGRREKAAQGGYAQGRPPFGYRAEGGELVPDDAEQVALKQMRRMRDRGKSYREIATALTAKGIAPRQSDRWHAQTVARIVERV
jgi:DNA invertase Pin-like site-specific DNA recombinase